jgi:hypothetical protein
LEQKNTLPENQEGYPHYILNVPLLLNLHAYQHDQILVVGLASVQNINQISSLGLVLNKSDVQLGHFG